MAGPLRSDRVKQTSTTTGTGTLNLDASILAGAIGFVAGIGNGNTVHYCIEHQTADEWEIGIGTVTDSATDTLSRTTVISSSNSGSAVSFSSGTKNVFVVAPAEYGLPIIKMVTTHAIILWRQDAGSQTAGNARGNYALDLQGFRTAADQVASGNYAVVSGGSRNKSSGTQSCIGGGNNNVASGTLSTIGGGGGNTASQTFTFIGGGDGNACGNKYNCIVGGYFNTCTGSQYSIVGGGIGNTASSTSCGVLGGDHNTASAACTVVGGGLRNTASAAYAAILGGRRAVADKTGQYAHACGLFNSNGDAQKSDYVLRKSTTTSTQAEMFLDGSSARMTLANDTTWAFDILIVARRTDANDESAAYLIQGCIDRNATAGTTAIVGSITKTVLAEDTSAWDVDVNADATNGALRIQVTGENSKTIQWVAHVRTVETTG